MANPINAQPLPLQGERLPADWRQHAQARARQAETDYMERMANAWRGSSEPRPEPLMRASRLTRDSASAHRVDSGAKESIRFDGGMELIEDRNGWEMWRDRTSGATVWRKKP